MFGFGKSDVRTLSPTEVHDRLGRGEIHLVDVREAREWAEGRIGGAVHIPLGELEHRLSELPADRPVVFYCLSGGRSSSAVNLCKRAGLPHDTHMAGGISAWRAHGLPVAR